LPAGTLARSTASRDTVVGSAGVPKPAARPQAATLVAARIAGHAGAGQVLVSGSVAESAPPQGVCFVEHGELSLKGFARPVRLLEARRV
jgi:hypothetical protein